MSEKCPHCGEDIKRQFTIRRSDGYELCWTINPGEPVISDPRGAEAIISYIQPFDRERHIFPSEIKPEPRPKGD